MSLYRYKRLRYRLDDVNEADKLNQANVLNDADDNRNNNTNTKAVISETEVELLPSPCQSTAMSSPSTTTTSKAKKLRAYRLNLERPFNICNEQSPLEYGDYMKIWCGEF